MKEETVPIKRSEVINIRVLPADAEILRERAQARGIALSTFCYLLIKDELERYNQEI
ncbi:hypothetical protein J7624_02560 [Wohlfahrtiimonas chitiniclastica]|uniref:Toxin-antitoxin system HicB family antitoxin n=1 Tax=Wohlfahrtiimonas chitiniclastica TaxID=400946 RepID=A0AB35BZC9_9GAMM|nr:hypothetical protein [Wohlfahrtiimonas chitiniclastica]MBS7825099.1 hypothetical protein [Wohlfahrtiimonas chitiniclastica]MBS7826033.1 hypothetical protein [Wohlfahrtiimonas chitiniclastica]MBS7838024.1 hypothetical protein [Wohlfahrtiimonas chitiniclastica]MBS7839704.1 hypothetical protein [Wohlfahrtiimonas chitiniclastica]